MLRRLDPEVNDRDARHCMFHLDMELTSGTAHLSLSISPIPRSKVIRHLVLLVARLFVYSRRFYVVVCGEVVRCLGACRYKGRQA